jgi:hypothetical protein
MRNKFLPLLLFSFFIFTFSFTKAQDTLAPHINMSQSAYDSIIRALKKSSSPKKDTTKQADTATHKIIVAPSQLGDMIDNDSARRAVERHRMDSAMKAASKDTVKHAADSGKKLKVKLLSNKHAGMDAYDSAKLAKRHRRDSTMRADSVKKYSKRDTLSHARKNKWQPDGFIAVNYGVGLPLDAFVTAGAAATGQDFSLCALFPGIVSRFGWAFKFDYGLNGINNPQYLYNVAEGYPNYIFKTVATAQGYTFYTLMMGPSFTFPHGKLTFDARMLFGVLIGTIPNSTYNVADSAGGNLTITRYKSTASAFAFSFGLDVRYKVLPYLSVILNYDYLTSNPQFTVASGGFNDTPLGITNAPVQASSVIQGFQLNSLTIGIAFNIAAKKK